MNDVVFCTCKTPDHHFIISYDAEFEEVFLHVHLVHLPFWKRVIRGIGYIFGRKSRFGSYDEIIISKEEKEKFLKIYEHLNGTSD